jgi:hypothetical protein
VFTEPLLRNGRLFIRLLHRNGCTRPFRGLCPATGLYATIHSVITDTLYRSNILVVTKQITASTLAHKNTIENRVHFPLHIQLKRSDNGVKLTPKHVTF